MALALLLWFIAALALLVAGLMGLSRQEVSAVRLQLAQAQAAAVGDGVARLVAQGLVLHDADSPPLQARLQVREFVVQVRLVPSSGFVDILRADQPLLEQVFSRVGGLEPDRAQALAASVVQWRLQSPNQGNSRIQGPSVLVLEDIMAVPGLTRDIFDRIRWFVCAGCNTGSLNLDEAPYSLRQALEWTRTETEPAAAGDKLTASGRYRVDARVMLGDGTVMQRSVWISNDKLGRRFPAFRVPGLNFESDNFGQE